ncbi:MgtC/SapB family protein [bacterium]|nr:MgtC/SapB family protein [bacterium]
MHEISFANDLALLLDHTYWIRIAASLACGAAIGFEREYRKKAAGLRTHMAIALGAAIFASTSTLIGDIHGTAVDPYRITAQIVTGIGFLGAGVIIHVGANVKGLTTAATIWVTAAVGTLVGIGYPLTGFALTLATVVMLVAFDRLEKALLRNGDQPRLPLDESGPSGSTPASP